jgi:hypothetical protein
MEVNGKHTSGLRGFILYSTLGHVWGGKVVEVTTFSGLLRHTLANGALVYPSKVEGIVLKAAWHWGSDSSVVNDPLVEPGRTLLYVVLPSAWSSVDGDRMLSLHFVGGFILGTPTVINDWINHWLWKRDISLPRDPVGVTWRGLSYRVIRGLFFLLVYLGSFFWTLRMLRI